MAGSDAQRVVFAELLQELRYYMQTMTDWNERLAGQLVNHTLEVWSGELDASAFLARSYGVAAGCVRVVLPAGGSVVVSSAGPGASAPTGTGTWIVGHADAAYASEVIPLASRQFSIYGTEGQLVQFQAFTAPVRPDTEGLVAFAPAAP